MQATFPYLARWNSIRFWPEGMSLAPQTSITGADTVVPVPRGRWMASGVAIVRGEEGFLQWQAFLAQMQGRVGTTLVPCQTVYGPKDRNGQALPFDRTGGISGAQTFEQFGFKAAAGDRVTVLGGAGLRATQMDLRFGDTTGLRPGQYFSIGERLHQVQTHWQPEPNRHRVTFHPPLRQAVAQDAPVEIARPVCKMRFTTETEGALPQAYGQRMPKITVNFVEAL